MTKFKNPVPEEPKAPPVCHICHWDFIVDNRRRVEFDPEYQPGRTRTEPRTAISRRDGRLICDLCFDKALFVVGKHPAIGTLLELQVRDALWPHLRDPALKRHPPQQSHREESLEFLNEFLGKFGSA